MKQFRKKPVVIEAVQWDGTTEQAIEIDTWMHGCATVMTDAKRPDYCELTIETLEGVMRVDPGDYVIRGIQGEFYPCKPDIFAETYEEVERG